MKRIKLFNILLAVATVTLVVLFVPNVHASFIVNPSTGTAINDQNVCSGYDCSDVCSGDGCLSLWKTDEEEDGWVPGAIEPEGPLASLYTLAYTGDGAFTITYGGTAGLVDDIEWHSMIVKDGNQTPCLYVFDISSWDGYVQIVGSGFWTSPTQGAISHVELCGTGAVPIPAAAWIFGAGLVGLVGIRRKFSS